MERRSASEKIQLVYDTLKITEPQTPNEIALTLEMNQKTVQSILLELMSTTDDVRWKKIGRYRIFWKVSAKQS